MKTMKTMRHLERTAENICFVGIWLNKTNTLGAGNREKASYPFICFMFSEFVHTFLPWLSQNMKVMKIYEARFIKGIYLPCFIWRGSPSRKHEANMKKYEEVGMKRNLIYLILAMVLTACGTPIAQAASLGTPEVIFSASPAATATVTLTPTPTVDWQGTAVIAQQTADEARRLNTAATAAHEQRVHEESAWTAQADMWTAQSDSWTATLALTTIPLTSTQQAAVNTQVPIDQALMAGQLTATHEAPDLALKAAQVDYFEQYGWVNYFAVAALGFGMFGLGVFALSKSKSSNRTMVTYQQTAELEALAVDEAATKVVADPIQREDLVPLMDNDEPRVLVVVHENPNGGPGEERFYVPCTDDQLFELAARVLDDGATLGINNWEGDETELTRKAMKRLRGYFQEKQLVTSLGAGRLKFNERGLALLRVVRGRKPLPSSSDGAVGDESPFGMSHETGAHVSAHGGGE